MVDPLTRSTVGVWHTRSICWGDYQCSQCLPVLGAMVFQLEFRLWPVIWTTSEFFGLGWRLKQHNHGWTARSAARQFRGPEYRTEEASSFFSLSDVLTKCDSQHRFLNSVRHPRVVMSMGSSFDDLTYCFPCRLFILSSFADIFTVSQ